MLLKIKLFFTVIFDFISTVIWKFKKFVSVKIQVAIISYVDRKYGMTTEGKFTIKRILQFKLREHYHEDIPDSVLKDTWGYVFQHFVFIEKPMDYFKVAKKIEKLKKYDRMHGMTEDEFFGKSDEEKLGLDDMPEIQEDDRP